MSDPFNTSWLAPTAHELHGPEVGTDISGFFGGAPPGIVLVVTDVYVGIEVSPVGAVCSAAVLFGVDLFPIDSDTKSAVAGEIALTFHFKGPYVVYPENGFGVRSTSDHSATHYAILVGYFVYEPQRLPPYPP